MGSPFINCALVVAHCCLHSGRHSARVFCSTPLGLVHSYIHLDKQASNSGSFFVPFTASSLAHAGDGVPIPNAATVTVIAAVATADDRNLDRVTSRVVVVDVVVVGVVKVVVVVVKPSGMVHLFRLLLVVVLPPLNPSVPPRQRRLVTMTMMLTEDFMTCKKREEKKTQTHPQNSTSIVRGIDMKKAQSRKFIPNGRFSLHDCSYLFLDRQSVFFFLFSSVRRRPSPT